ncbi:MAG: prolipoprotein diacylglyceryl transferase [Candidatus Absconditabacterales bacterium]
MIAFTIFGWPIYWYGIMYLISFLIGYAYLRFISRTSLFANYPRLQSLLKDQLDDVMFAIMLGVLLGGRLGDVVLYNRSYYSQHLIQILYIWNGGMSFVGGLIGVATAIRIIKYIKKLTYADIFVLFDAIVFILPLAILLGRIGNGLNQELYGKMISFSTIKERGVSIETLYKFHIIRIYNLIDNQYRRNTNLLEGFFEGFMLFVIQSVRFGVYFIKGGVIGYYPGLVTGRFCIVYGMLRFFLEILRDNPHSEYIWGVLKSQLLMVLMIFLGVGILLVMRQYSSKLDKAK